MGGQWAYEEGIPDLMQPTGLLHEHLLDGCLSPSIRHHHPHIGRYQAV
jgi:hypothetical protein